MELKGKRVAFLGDSITAGVGAGEIKNRFTDVFERMTESVSLNYGVSGTRIARQKKADDPYYEDFNRRVSRMDENADVIVVFGGTNDYGHGDAPLGKLGDDTEYTFYGAVSVLCQSLLDKYPRATIVFMTPLHRLNENTAINEFGFAHEPLSAYVKAIKEVAEYYALPVLDLYSTSGFQPAVKSIRDIYTPDGLHPSAAGAERIAIRLKNFLQTL